MSDNFKFELLDPGLVTNNLQTLIGNFAFPDTFISCKDGQVVLNRILVGIIFPFLKDSHPFTTISNISIILPDLTLEQFWSSLSVCLGIKESDIQEKESPVNITNIVESDDQIDEIAPVEDFLLKEYEHEAADLAEEMEDMFQAVEHQNIINKHINEEIQMKKSEIEKVEKQMLEDENNFNLPNSDSNKDLNISDEIFGLTDNGLEFSKECMLKKTLKENMVFQNSNLALSFIFTWCDNNLSPLRIESETLNSPTINGKPEKLGRIVLKCPHGPRSDEDRGCPVMMTLTGRKGGHFILDRAELEHQNHEVSYRLYRTFIKPRRVKEIEEDKEGIIDGLLKTGLSTTEVVEYFSGYNTMDVGIHQILEIFKRLNKIKETDIHEEEIDVLMKKHSNRPGQNCSICLQSFKTKSALLTHMLNEHEISIPVQCPKCDVESGNIKKFRKHKIEVHTTLPQLTRCDLCKKTTKNIDNHMKTHSVKDTNSFECDVCGHKSGSPINLEVHRRVHSDVKMFKCKHCEKAFKWPSSLKCHIEAAHSKATPSFICEECSHPFKDRGNLVKHMFTHKTDKPHKCDKCGKGWIRLDFLKNHKCVPTK